MNFLWHFPGRRLTDDYEKMITLKIISSSTKNMSTVYSLRDFINDGETFGKHYWGKLHTSLTKHCEKLSDKPRHKYHTKPSVKWIVTYEEQLFEDKCRHLQTILAVIDNDNNLPIAEIFANFIFNYIINEGKHTEDILLHLSMMMNQEKTDKYNIIDFEPDEDHIIPYTNESMYEYFITHKKDQYKLLDIINDIIKDHTTDDDTLCLYSNVGFMTSRLTCKKYENIEIVPARI